MQIKHAMKLVKNMEMVDFKLTKVNMYVEANVFAVTLKSEELGITLGVRLKKECRQLRMEVLQHEE